MIYFEGVNADQVSDVLDDLKGIDVCYEVGQVMHDGFTKTMAVVLSATETDQVTQACQLIEQCYNSPGKFHPECTYNEKEVEKEVLSTLIDKGGAMINFNDYYFQLWCDFSLKLIIVNIKLVLPQVKPRELKELICKLCEVELVNIEFICCNNTYQGFVKGTVASKQDLLTILEHDNVELFIGCPKVHFHRKMSQEEFKKVVLPLSVPAPPLLAVPNHCDHSRLTTGVKSPKPMLPTSGPTRWCKMLPERLSKLSRPGISSSRRPGPERWPQPCSTGSRSAWHVQPSIVRTPSWCWVLLLLCALCSLVLLCGAYHDYVAERQVLGHCFPSSHKHFITPVYFICRCRAGNAL